MSGYRSVSRDVKHRCTVDFFDQELEIRSTGGIAFALGRDGVGLTPILLVESLLNDGLHEMIQDPRWFQRSITEEFENWPV